MNHELIPFLVAHHDLWLKKRERFLGRISSRSTDASRQTDSFSFLERGKMILINLSLIKTESFFDLHKLPTNLESNLQVDSFLISNLYHKARLIHSSSSSC